LSVVSAMARTQPAVARRIVEAHINDAALRAQAMTALERAMSPPR